jgi:hypothetical protein
LKSGKRKALRVQVANGTREEKRYRLVDEGEEDTSDDEAVATKQPYYTQ